MSGETSHIISLLGLARRAGKLAVGRSAVETMADKSSKILVVIAKDLPEDRKNKIAQSFDRALIVDDLIDSNTLAASFNRKELVMVATNYISIINGIVVSSNNQK